MIGLARLINIVEHLLYVLKFISRCRTLNAHIFRWKKATIPLGYKENFRFSIIGTIGSSYEGDIAIDDIKMVNCKPCKYTVQVKGGQYSTFFLFKIIVFYSGKVSHFNVCDNIIAKQYSDLQLFYSGERQPWRVHV